MQTNTHGEYFLKKEKMTVFGMNPPACEVAYQWEMFGFAVLQSLGIKADEL